MEKRGRKRKNSQMQSGMQILACLFVLICQIPLTGMIGDDGNAYYTAAYETCAVLMLFAAFGLPRAVTRMVLVRTAKWQLKNAARVFKVSVLFSCLWGAAGTALLFFGADLIAGDLLMEPLCRYPLQAFAPFMFICCAGGSLSAYFRGLGSEMPVAVSRLLAGCIWFAAALIAAKFLAVHGTDVGNLLRNAHFTAAYGGMGAAIGAGIGGLISLLFLLVVYGMLRGQLRTQAQRDGVRSIEPAGRIFGQLLRFALPAVAPLLLYHLGYLAQQALFCRYMSENGMAQQQALQWGVYFGKYRILTEIGVAPAVIVGLSLFPFATAVMSKIDNKMARDRTQIAMRLVVFLTMPFVVFLAVMAKPLTEYFYTGDTQLAAALLKVGSLQVLLLAAAAVTTGILERLGQSIRVLLNVAAAVVVQLGLFVVFLRYLDLSVYAAVYAQMAAAFVLILLNQLTIGRLLNYKQEWIRAFLIPIGTSLVMGGIDYLLFLGLSRLMGNMAVLPVFCVGILLYLFAVIALRGISGRDLSRIPLGGFAARAAKAMGIL